MKKEIEDYLKGAIKETVLKCLGDKYKEHIEKIKHKKTIDIIKDFISYELEENLESATLAAEIIITYQASLLARKQLIEKFAKEDSK